MTKMIKIGMDAKSKSINNKLKETKWEFQSSFKKLNDNLDELNKKQEEQKKALNDRIKFEVDKINKTFQTTKESTKANLLKESQHV